MATDDRDAAASPDAANPSRPAENGRKKIKRDRNRLAQRGRARAPLGQTDIRTPQVGPGATIGAQRHP